MKAPNAHEIGLRIRAILRKRGLSLEEGARLLGVPRNVLSNAVNGYNTPKHGLGLAIVQLLPGLTLEWLYWGNGRLVPSRLSRELSIFVEAYRQGLELPEAPEESDDPPEEAAASVPGGPKRSAARAG